MKKITISGGGLAGLGLALGLRRHGVDVAVHECLHYPRHRVCGEFISGVSEATLANLGMTEVMSDSLRPCRVTWWREGALLRRDQLPDAAYAQSRYQLDARLVALLRQLGGTVHEGTRMAVNRDEGHVWAAGRRPDRGPWLGLKAHVRFPAHDNDAPAALEMHIGRNGYVGLTPIEDGWVNICGLFRRDAAIKASPQQLLLAYLQAGRQSFLVERLQRAQWREHSFSATAGIRLGYQREVAHLTALGDAHSIIPPFTGNGMSMALQAAEIAIRPLVAWSAGDCSWLESQKEIAAALTRTFHTRLRLALPLNAMLTHHTGQWLLSQLAPQPFFPFHLLLSHLR